MGLFDGIFSRGRDRKDKQFAEGLALLALTLADQDKKSDYFEKNGINRHDEDSFFFSMSILNTVLASFSVNMTMKVDHSRKVLILDHMVETFISMAGSDKRTISVDNIIKSPPEIGHIAAKWGTGKFETNIKTLLDTFYNKRMDDYEYGIKEALKLLHSRVIGGSTSPLDELIDMFQEHAHGCSADEDLIAVIKYKTTLSAMIMSTMDAFSTVCREHC